MSGFEWRKVSSNISETSQELCKKLTKCQVFIEEGEFEHKWDEPYKEFTDAATIWKFNNKLVVVAESVYAHVWGACGEILGGSSPPYDTIKLNCHAELVSTSYK